MPDPESEITITLGATEAIFSAILALVHPGDEVILFDPSYDSYAPAVLLAGGRPIHIPLEPPHFHIDWQRVRDAVTPKLRLIMINTPHNPTGSMLDPRELDTLAEIAAADAGVRADRTKSTSTWSSTARATRASSTHTELYERGIAVFSFGKTMHATGWRVGYAVAPPAITTRDSPCASVQYLQHRSAAAACDCRFSEKLAGAQQPPGRVLSAQARQVPRWPARLQLQLDPVGRHVLPAARFQRDLGRERHASSSRRCCARPASPPFLSRRSMCSRRGCPCVRFCFAKSDSTLEDAAERLCHL